MMIHGKLSVIRKLIQGFRKVVLPLCRTPTGHVDIDNTED